MNLRNEIQRRKMDQEKFQMEKQGFQTGIDEKEAAKKRYNQFRSYFQPQTATFGAPAPSVPRMPMFNAGTGMGIQAPSFLRTQQPPGIPMHSVGVTPTLRQGLINAARSDMPFVEEMIGKPGIVDLARLGSHELSRDEILVSGEGKKIAEGEETSKEDKLIEVGDGIWNATKHEWELQPRGNQDKGKKSLTGNIAFENDPEFNELKTRQKALVEEGKLASGKVISTQKLKGKLAEKRHAEAITKREQVSNDSLDTYIRRDEIANSFVMKGDKSLVSDPGEIDNLYKQWLKKVFPDELNPHTIERKAHFYNEYKKRLNELNK